MSSKIFGVTITNNTSKQILEVISDRLNQTGQAYICTINPEILVFSYFNKFYKTILNNSLLNTCDGFGARIATKFKANKYTGVEMMSDICELAAKKNKKIYLLGSSSNNILKNLEQNLKNKYNNLIIAGSNIGSKIVLFEDELLFEENSLGFKNNDQVIDHIIDIAPDILFVAYGHPKQEMWISKFLKEIPSVKIAIGVGGSFDYLSGKIKRPNKLLRRLGLEWLGRLINNPKRIFRIINAVIIFPLLFIYSEIKILLIKKYVK